jgi:anti-anti-sigma factor
VANSAVSLPKLDEPTAGGERRALTLRIERDLCYDCAHEVEAAVRYLVVRSPAEIVVELGDVNLVDSSGLRALLAARDICGQAGVGFRLDKMSDYVTRIVRLSRLGALLGLPEPEAPDTFGPHGVCLGATTWKTWEHVAASDPALIAVLRDKVTTAAQEAGACGQVLCDIGIAVGEALSNAYRHGSRAKSESRILVRCMTCSAAVVVEIEDEGEPFNPSDTPEPDPRNLKDHGMGIYLMRRAMDVVEFASNRPGNQVRMVKWLPGEG